MIKIDFVEPTTLAWTRWRSTCAKKTKELVDGVAAGGDVVVDDTYKRKTIKDEVYFSKSGPFAGKCAYCECYITDFQHGDIEHYRPKKGVTDEDDVPVTHDDGSGATVAHRGYYWLAYDWQNLLPSCTDCNQPSTVDGKKLGKHNRFPVEGAHATRAEEVAGEKPLLLNPVVDDPAEHLEVDLSTGLMIGLTERGKKCIEIFGLNVRDRLPQERLRAIREVKALWLELANAPSPATFEQLKEIKAGRTSFAHAGRAELEELLEHVRPLGGPG